MRTPLLVLVVTYSIAVVGLMAVPGYKPDGTLWHMDFFHATYFVSYMATTIGFGELPYEFSDEQRLWILFCIYASVIAWLYSIGSLIALLQDKTLRRALAEDRFAAQVRRLREPFFLICGYGQTGSGLVRALSNAGQRTVVVDDQEARINQLKLENLREFVPALHADARCPDILLLAGLRNRHCHGVLALTSTNEVNLKIAIAAKLLNPRIAVVCRTDSQDVKANMASFGTEHIFNPFDLFAQYLGIALQNPCLALLHDWLGAPDGAPLKDPRHLPEHGLWIVCGYGRFGKAVMRQLVEYKFDTVVIEATPEITGTPPGRLVAGRGTEANTLEQAGVHQAVGLIAGTDCDVNNLSIVMTARTLNPELFVVVRENDLLNQQLFDAVAADIRMHPSLIVADRVRLLLRTPLLNEFIHYAQYETATWACLLLSRIAGLVQDQAPMVWQVAIDEAHAIVTTWEAGNIPCLEDLLRHPREREQTLPAMILMRRQGQERTRLPDLGEPLRAGDELLLCGLPPARSAMQWTLQNCDVLDYVMFGRARPRTWIGRRLQTHHTSAPESSEVL